MRFYRGLQALLEIKRDDSRQTADYIGSLKLMYGEQSIIRNYLKGMQSYIRLNLRTGDSSG